MASASLPSARRGISGAASHGPVFEIINGGNSEDLVARSGGFGGSLVRLRGSGAGRGIEGPSSVAAVFDGASEGTGTVVREAGDGVEESHQMPDLSVDAIGRLRAAAL